MKLFKLPRINLLKITAFCCIAASASFTAVSAQEDTDGPRKILILTFQNQTPASDIVDSKKNTKLKDEESFDFLSDIIPLNLKREIESSGSFSVTIEKSAPESKKTSDTEKLSILSAKAAEKNVHFIVSGYYVARKGTLSISLDVFSARTSSIKNISVENVRMGVMIDTILSNLATAAVPEITRHVLHRTPAPSVSTAENPIQFYGSFSLKADSEKDEIWYTTSGELPEKGKGTLYKDAVSIRRTVRIKAVSIREGFLPSKPVESELTVKSPLSRLTIGQTFGSAIAVGTVRKYVRTDSMNHFSAYVQWDFANLTTLKNTSFMKNFALMGAFESCRFSDSFQTQSQSGAGFIAAGNLFAVYSMRPAEFMTLDLHAGGGYAKGKHIAPYNGGGALDIINITKKTGDPFNKPIFGGGFKLNYIWGTVFLHLDMSYRQVKIPNDAYLKVLYSGFGFGVRL